ncbi:hypothetical protein FBEOM_12584 [Fusarium beomiforme]|uniref:Uncharacterized protein n=1 Tax=Fusarium beomiforme TaxID=44412 RepID=A0A9P5DPG9_9HYPO|nr:hypothetical protein FBEOM_12584 [Fusarium beomiforme]
MAPHGFLRLPHEIWHYIYQEYFILENGYAFQPGSGKLAAADGQPLDLALMSTCWFIASETKKLPLKHNVVSFISGLRHVLRNSQRVQRPRTGRYLDAVLWGDNWRTRYEVSQAVKCTLRLVAQQLETSSEGHWIQSLEGWSGDREGLLDFLDEFYDPWDIPSWSELESMGQRFEDDDKWSRLQFWEVFQIRNAVAYRSKHRFSAAAVAIHNPRLRIEHRVSMLSHILQAGDIFFDTHMFKLRAEDPDRDGSKIGTSNVFRELSHWFVEALATVDGSMPPGSSSLVVDGEPVVDLCSEMFQHSVQRDAAFFIALERCFPRLVTRHDPTLLTNIGGRAVEALMHLVNETSVVRCNFYPGQMWDVDKFVKYFKGHEGDTESGIMDLYNKYHARERFEFELPIHLSSWLDLLMDNHESREILTSRDRREAGINRRYLPRHYGSRA